MNYEHGMWKSPEYATWTAMKSRCSNPKDTAFHRYGGRGIKVAEGWLQNFISFYEHVGPRPSSEYSIDRKNNDGNYEPGNVRWATREEQNANKRPMPRRTHCKRGHLLDPSFDFHKANGGLRCKLCQRMMDAAQKRKHYWRKRLGKDTQ